MWKLLVLALLCLEYCLSLDINCSSFEALDANVTTSREGQKYFKVEIDSNGWTPGKSIKVTLKSKDIDSMKQTFKSFILQAHTVANEPVGTWELTSAASHMTHPCKSFGDTLTNRDHIPETDEVVAMWHPPANVQNIPNNGEIDFNAAVIGVHGGKKYTWIEIRSNAIQKVEEAVHDIAEETKEDAVDPAKEEKEAPPASEGSSTGTGENPTEGEQIEEQQQQRSQQLDQQGVDRDAEAQESYREETAAMLKEQEKRQKEIEDEDIESEGPWVAEEEREREAAEKEYEHEMQMYEKEKAEEEDRRQKMILLEIKDKEEHDKLMAEQSAKKDDSEIDFNEGDDLINDKTINGVSRTTVSLATLLMTIAVMFF